MSKVGQGERTMTWNEFEVFCVNEFADNGAWVHRFAKSNTGSQPFDIIAIRGNIIYAIDCKVVSTERPYFPFSRIELNQKGAMESLKKKYAGALCRGFLIYHKEKIYFLSFEKFLDLEEKGRKGVKLEDCWGFVF